MICAYATEKGGVSISPKSPANRQPIVILLAPQQSAAQNTTFENMETLPDANLIKAARYYALQKRVTALHAEVTAIMEEIHLIITV